MTQPLRVLADNAWMVWGRWLVVMLLSILTGLAIPAFRVARAVDQRIASLENHRSLVVAPFIEEGGRYTPTDAEAMKNEILLAVEQSMAAHVLAGPHGDVAQRLDRIERLLLERLPAR